MVDLEWLDDWRVLNLLPQIILISSNFSKLFLRILLLAIVWLRPSHEPDPLKNEAPRTQTIFHELLNVEKFIVFFLEALVEAVGA